MCIVGRLRSSFLDLSHSHLCMFFSLSPSLSLSHRRRLLLQSPVSYIFCLLPNICIVWKFYQEKKLPLLLFFSGCVWKCIGNDSCLTIIPWRNILKRKVTSTIYKPVGLVLYIRCILWLCVILNLFHDSISLPFYNLCTMSYYKNYKAEKMYSCRTELYIANELWVGNLGWSKYFWQNVQFHFNGIYNNKSRWDIFISRLFFKSVKGLDRF